MGKSLATRHRNKRGSQWFVVMPFCGNFYFKVRYMQCSKKANQAQEFLSGGRKLNRKQEPLLVCCFVDCSHVLIFSVINCNTINIPEIFQVFTVPQSHCKN